MLDNRVILLSRKLDGAATKTVPLLDSLTEEMKGGNISTSMREKPDFTAMTAGRGMLGPLGAITMVSAGNKIVEENNIEDPASYIAKSLAHELSRRYGLNVNTEEEVRASGNSSSALAKTSFESDYLLDVQTTNWNLSYFPTN